jgi:uroporphyrinogen III methyltransferase/synthase
MKEPGRAPLAGRRVLVTRATEQASELIRILEAAGAAVIHVPAIRLVPPPSWDSLDRLIDNPTEWDRVVFTSTNGVAFFAERSRTKGHDPSEISHARIAAVGTATADALRAHGIEPDVVPGHFRGSEISRHLPDDQTGIRTAVVRALEGRDELIDDLRAKGGEVHLAVAYETLALEALPDDARNALLAGSVAVLTFTSPSTAINVLRHLSPDELEVVKAQSKFVSIGPTTTAALHTFDVGDVVEARETSVKGLVEAIVGTIANV